MEICKNCKTVNKRLLMAPDIVGGSSNDNQIFKELLTFQQTFSISMPILESFIGFSLFIFFVFHIVYTKHKRKETIN